MELPDGNGWRIVKSVRGAKDRKIIAKLDAPLRTSRVRVQVLRELYEGHDRQYADVESIRVLDRTGRNCALSGVAPMHVSGVLEGELPPPAVAVARTSAEVLARFDRPVNAPAILRNKFGKGRAWLLTCAAIPNDATCLSNLCKLTLGESSFIVRTNDVGRFRFILTCVGDALVLHVIDAAVPATQYQSQLIEVSLTARQLGGRCQATLAGSDKVLTLSEKEGRIHFSVQPNPVATIVFNGAKR